MQLANALTTLLDESKAARRPEPDERLWLAPAGLGKRREADVLLARILDTLRAVSPRPVQLLADAGLDAADFPPGTWRQRAAGQWELPADFAAAQFLKSQLHAEGNYALVVMSSDQVIAAVPPDLPWWGPARWRGRAERITRGLRASSIDVALAVHHDASNCILAIAAD